MTRPSESPFEGVVGQRLVSVGDYVTRGTKVASVMRTGPLRVELTVPEQSDLLSIAVGREVRLAVDAYPGQNVHRTRALCIAGGESRLALAADRSRGRTTGREC